MSVINSFDAALEKAKAAKIKWVSIIKASADVVPERYFTS